MPTPELTLHHHEAAGAAVDPMAMTAAELAACIAAQPMCGGERSLGLAIAGHGAWANAENRHGRRCELRIEAARRTGEGRGRGMLVSVHAGAWDEAPSTAALVDAALAAGQGFARTEGLWTLASRRPRWPAQGWQTDDPTTTLALVRLLWDAVQRRAAQGRPPKRPPGAPERNADATYVAAVPTGSPKGPRRALRLEPRRITATTVENAVRTTGDAQGTMVNLTADIPWVDGAGTADDAPLRRIRLYRRGDGSIRADDYSSGDTARHRLAERALADGRPRNDRHRNGDHEGDANDIAGWLRRTMARTVRLSERARRDVRLRIDEPWQPSRVRDACAWTGWATIRRRDGTIMGEIGCHTRTGGLTFRGTTGANGTDDALAETLRELPRARVARPRRQGLIQPTDAETSAADARLRRRGGVELRLEPDHLRNRPLTDGELRRALTAIRDGLVRGGPTAPQRRAERAGTAR